MADGREVLIRPIFRLAGSYVMCIPPEWVEMWLRTDDMWVSVEDLKGELGFVAKPYLKSLPKAASTLPLGI